VRSKRGKHIGTFGGCQKPRAGGNSTHRASERKTASGEGVRLAAGGSSRGGLLPNPQVPTPRRSAPRGRQRKRKMIAAANASGRTILHQSILSADQEHGSQDTGGMKVPGRQISDHQQPRRQSSETCRKRDLAHYIPHGVACPSGNTRSRSGRRRAYCRMSFGACQVCAAQRHGAG